MVIGFCCKPTINWKNFEVTELWNFRQKRDFLEKKFSLRKDEEKPLLGSAGSVC